MIENQVIINIPGKWADRLELIEAVKSQSEDYFMGGMLIFNLKKNTSFQIRVFNHEPNLKDILSAESRGTFNDSLLNDIDEHTCVVQVISNRNELEDIQELIDIGTILLKAGGLAVEIEASGTAHTKENWYKLSENKDYLLIYYYFVTLIGHGNFYYSRGMKMFGLPDVVISSSISSNEVANILNQFNLYHLVDKPYFENGHTFSLDENSTIYRIQFVNDFRYEEDVIFFNPFGLVHITKNEYTN